MALIIDPDSLTDTTSIIISTATSTVRLVSAGSLTSDGVTIKCVYSKLKELWKDNATYIKFPFPMTPITDEQFEMVNGWDWFDDTTRNFLRTGGWAVKNTSGVSTQEWAGVITLGSLNPTDQVYFQQSATGPASAAANIVLTGAVNQAIKVYDSSGPLEYRSYLKLFCRTWGYSYASSQLSDIGVTTLTYQAYRFPLANSTDVKIVSTESHIASAAPYTGMSITWYPAVQQRTGFTTGVGTSAAFHVIIDSNSGTATQTYEYVQSQLRKNSDIDAGAGIQIGKVTSAILRFVGDTLYTYKLTEGGTAIDGYLSADKNNLVFLDDTNAERIYPYVSVLIINFGDNLKNDASAKYWVYFSTTPSGGVACDYGTSNAILVNDGEASPTTITGTVASASSVQRTFDYDGNVQGGRVITPAGDVAITAVSIGLSTGQFVKTTGTIAKSKANSISLVAPLERNYSNPA